MRFPLIRRLPRQLAHNAGRYLGIFLLISVSIAFVSGFLVAASSIERIIADMPQTYEMQDGQFTTTFEAPKEAIDEVEKLGVSIEPEFSRDITITWSADNESSASSKDAVRTEATARLFEDREAFDLVSYAEGSAPTGETEIALDRVFCANNQLSIGDVVKASGQNFTISGICTLPDYSSLFEDPGDFVFNALTFTTGILSPEGFESLDGPITYTYAYQIDGAPLSRSDETDLLQKIGETLSENGAMPLSLMNASSNNAMSYAQDDVEGDQLMWEVMLVMLIVIMAFVFVVITNSGIEAESAMIGTLLASGYRKRELIAHYMALPTFIGIIAAAVGNIVGYTALYAPMRDVYYNSYSLPPYEAFWNWRVFIICTVVPVALLILVNLFGLMRKLRCTPLEFLRHETTKRSRRRGIALPEKLSFSSRFRLRIFLCNLPSFLTLFCGIAFASLLLIFGLCMMPVMDNYAQNLKSDMVSEHQYILKAPLEIDVTEEESAAQKAAETLAMTPPDDLAEMDPADLMKLYADTAIVDADSDTVWNTEGNPKDVIEQAEKFAVASAEVKLPGDFGWEEISVYGISPQSDYWSDVDVSEGESRADIFSNVEYAAVIGRGLAEKCGLSIGESFVLNDPFSAKSYGLYISGITGSTANMNAYLSLDSFNAMLDNDGDYFNGYVSNDALSLDDLYVVSDLTPSAMDKITIQLSDSMGTVTNMLVLLAIIIFVVLIYLLTKTVIDRSARSISYMKVFGYRPREVNKLYIHSITTTVIASLLLCLPLIVVLINWLVRFAFMEYNGNFEVVVPPTEMAIEVVIGIVCYAIVAVVHTARIRKVPLSIALKVQE